MLNNCKKSIKHCSCIILNYNDYKTTVDAIKMIKEMHYFEKICIVDNCSNDGSYEKLKDLEDDEIVVLCTDRNGGYGYGNNFGIKYLREYTSSEFLLIINPDIVVEKNTIERLETYLEANRDCAIVSAVPLSTEKKRVERSGWNIGSKWRYVLEVNVIVGKLFSINKSEQTGEIMRYDSIQGSMLMLRIEEMYKYGMYDEQFFLYCEEDVLGWKFRNNGMYSAVLEDIFYIHNHSVTSKKNIKSDFLRQRLLLKSKLLFVKKYMHIKGVGLLVTYLYFFVSLFINSLVIWIQSKVKNFVIKN